MSERPEKIYSDAQAKIDGGGLRYDTGKIRYDLVPPEWEHALAEVLTAGAAKYADRNWERGMPWSKMVGCARRHLFKWLRGESFDAETGCHHLAHAAWNILALMSYQLRAVGQNDLPEPVMHPTKIQVPDVQKAPPDDPRVPFAPKVSDALEKLVSKTGPRHCVPVASSLECPPRLQQVEPAGDQHPPQEVKERQQHEREAQHRLALLRGLQGPLLPAAFPLEPSPETVAESVYGSVSAHDDGA